MSYSGKRQITLENFGLRKRPKGDSVDSVETTAHDGECDSAGAGTNLEGMEAESSMMVIDVESSGSEKKGDAGPSPKQVTRSFRQEWKSQFKWLRLNSDGTITCESCAEAKQNNQWARGKKAPASGWQKDQLGDHDKSMGHKNALGKQRMATWMKTSMKVQRDKAEVEVLMAMKNVLYVVQNEMSAHKSTSLHELVSEQIRTVSTVDQVEMKTNPSSHTSNFSTNEFIQAMSAIELDKLKTELDGAVGFTLHLDESTDITHDKSLLQFVQFVTADGVLHNKFLGAISLQETDAASISNAVMNFCEENAIDLKKMTMFVSDGAAVMLGARNGVAQKLRENVGNQMMIEFHCAAHREALALKDAFEASDFFSDLDLKLRDLVTRLRTGKRSIKLKETAKLLDEPFVQLTKWFEIRWLTRLLVVDSFLKDLPVIQTTLAIIRENDSVANRLFNELTSPRFVYALHVLRDLLEPLTQLNKVLQKKNVHPFTVAAKIEITIEELRALFINDFVEGVTVRNMHAKIAEGRLQLCQPPTTETSLEDIWKHVKDETKALAEGIVLSLQHRFLSNSEVIKAASIFMPMKYKGLSSAEMRKAGIVEFNFLAEHYQKLGISPAEAEYEWENFKRDVIGLQRTDDASSWFSVLQAAVADSDLYPNISIIAKVILCFDASNAEVERGFSLYNRLKTKIRNRLSVNELDRRIRLCINAASWKSFQYDAAFQRWKKNSLRGRYNIATSCK